MVVTRFAMPASAVIVAWFHFTVRSNAGVAAPIITAFMVPAMVITTLAFAASDRRAGIAATVITAFVMPAMIIT
ncbi:MAG TPA: hypothetical protein VLI42_01905, partial [Chthoniobacterales bacterium]|nr:hypothetical protein [Chthoniobacterales bacterium]